MSNTSLHLLFPYLSSPHQKTSTSSHNSCPLLYTVNTSILSGLQSSCHTLNNIPLSSTAIIVRFSFVMPSSLSTVQSSSSYSPQMYSLTWRVYLLIRLKLSIMSMGNRSFSLVHSTFIHFLSLQDPAISPRSLCLVLAWYFELWKGFNTSLVTLAKWSIWKF